MENAPSQFDFNEFSSIDIKALLMKVFSHWKWFLVSLIVAFVATKYYNEYQPRIYSLTSLITVKEENNPIFSSSTNIAFNWGGPSDKVETIKTILQSRTHNEKVVQNMQYYIEYLQEGKYRMEDVYGSVPFNIVVDTSYYQLINTLIKLEFTSDNKVNLSVDFDENLNRSLLKYSNASKQIYTAQKNNYTQEFPIGKIKTDFVKIDINLINEPQVNMAYYVRLKDYNSTVAHYRNIGVSTEKKGTSLIKLSLKGTNKKRIVDFINTTVKILEKDQIAAKIRYAVKTKEYIDTLFRDMSGSLKNIEADIGSFKQDQNIYNLSAEGTAIFGDVLQLDKQILNLEDRLEYFASLNTYINSHDSFEPNTIPVPAVLKMEDSKISQSIGVLISKYKQRETLLQTVTTEFPTVKHLDADIELERNALLENLSMLNFETKKSLSKVKSRLNNNQYRLKKLPKREQKLLSFERKYAITERNYNYLKQKSYEAGTAIASNVSDIKVIDNAKDVGQGFISPKKQFNTIAGLLIALLLPLVFILINEFLNNKISTVEEVENGFKIPILGVIGTKTDKSNLIVFDNPKSSMAEAYRSLRSNVQFMLKRNLKSHVILLTSSISGEGKTLTAINLASVFALSGKKTILVGVDLRKPKIAAEFNMNNNLGLVHYLINQKEANQVIKKSEYENLDILLSGPIPPNPSELLLSEETANMMDYLRDNYEYIILDAPPIGAVSDAQELFTYADVILYLIRQGHTDKGLLKMIETKYKRKEVSTISYVLNDFTFNKRNGYGYGGYGYGGYGYGYYQEEELPFFKRMMKKFKRKA